MVPDYVRIAKDLHMFMIALQADLIRRFNVLKRFIGHSISFLSLFSLTLEHIPKRLLIYPEFLQKIPFSQILLRCIPFFYKTSVCSCPARRDVDEHLTDKPSVFSLSAISSRPPAIYGQKTSNGMHP